MAQFQPPPTYANPILTDEVTKQVTFNPIWLKWFVDIASFLSSGAGSGSDGSSTGEGNFVRQSGPTINDPMLTDPVLGNATGSSLVLSGGVSAGAASFSGLLTVPGGSPLLRANAALTDGAGAAAGTLANAPSAGNPTKWIAIDDAGTTRRIPTW